jgi:uncharacterized protein (UPF0332 family)
LKSLWLRGRAETSVSSAKLLLENGDIIGACNRAYYAMFYIAYAGLLEHGAPVNYSVGKTHKGLISAFSQHLVKPGVLSAELAQALGRAHEVRVWADYTGENPSLDVARKQVQSASDFVETITRKLF